ncbi:MAG: ribonuclease R [Bacteroidales bacterium]|nr:ribonuclease R [Bacteroidales bacterium]
MKNIEKLIVEALASTTEKHNYKQIAAKINIYDKKGREEVKEAIEKLVRTKILLKAGRGNYRINSKFLTKESTGRNYATGRLEVKQSGAAFVLQEGDAEDIFIAERHIGNALHNDLVKVLLFPPRKDSKPEGQIVEILERSTKQLVGVIQIEKGIAFFTPDSNHYRRDILIPGRLLKKAKSGYKVVVRIVDWTPGSKNPIGEVIKVLGKPGNNDVEMQSILAENDFPLSFPQEAEEEATRMERPITAEEIRKRRDFRNVTTFTVDPADAKDFDDALSYERLPNGHHQIGVHIADVSYYVKPGSAIDREAYERGTSVYLVDRTIPMLPEALSNNLCSLRPHEDKLCFSAIFEMDDNARVVKEWFGHTVINSNERFCYEEVQETIDSGKGKLAEEILQINGLARILRRKRFENNAINFETEEVKFKLDENAKPIGVYIKVSTEANFMIEEFMLLANKRVAEKIGKKTTANREPKTFVYRVHDKPLEEKLATFRNFVKKIGYEFKLGSTKVIASSYNNLLEQAKGSQEYDMLSKLSIRTMARAVYSTENIGHYGLAFPFYTHFTSPIRRYPDLMVHRLLDAYLHKAASADAGEFETYCQHCSQMEQKATEAERSSVKYKQAEYMADKVGQVFDATVSGICKWGVFAEIKDTKCEGLIAMRKFNDDFYYIDEDNYTLVGLHQGHSYRFGDTIRIKVMAVDLMRKQMDFDIVY